MSKPLIFLASASPRRSALLEQIAVPHEVRPVALDESPTAGEAPGPYVTRLARAKADVLWELLPADGRVAVLGSDTVVALGREMFGKPRDRQDAVSMLTRLAGRTHEVHTAVALRTAAGCEVRLSVSEVTFAAVEPRDIAAYCDSGEPLDKAGAYAVQGLAATFIARIAGSYSGIMGLPLFETAQLLRDAGLMSQRPPAWRAPA
jgi:nucleoside triphosphate pyrophosphatase